MRQPAPAPACSPADKAKLDELMSHDVHAGGLPPEHRLGAVRRHLRPGRRRPDDHARDRLQLRRRQPGRPHVGRVRRRPRRGRHLRGGPVRVDAGRGEELEGERAGTGPRDLERPLHLLHAEGLLAGHAAAGRRRDRDPRAAGDRRRQGPLRHDGQQVADRAGPLGRRSRPRARRPTSRRPASTRARPTASRTRTPGTARARPRAGPATARSTRTTRGRSASRRTCPSRRPPTRPRCGPSARRSVRPTCRRSRSR